MDNILHSFSLSKQLTSIFFYYKIIRDAVFQFFVRIKEQIFQLAVEKRAFPLSDPSTLGSVDRSVKWKAPSSFNLNL